MHLDASQKKMGHREKTKSIAPCSTSVACPGSLCAKILFLEKRSEGKFM